MKYKSLHDILSHCVLFQPGDTLSRWQRSAERPIRSRSDAEPRVARPLRQPARVAAEQSRQPHQSTVAESSQQPPFHSSAGADPPQPHGAEPSQQPACHAVRSGYDLRAAVAARARGTHDQDKKPSLFARRSARLSSRLPEFSESVRQS